MELNTQGESG